MMQMQPQQQQQADEHEQEEEEEEIDLHQTPTHPNLQWPLGLPVQTPYGWGTVRRCRRGPHVMLEVRLEWHAVCFLPPTALLDRAVVPLGACVLTTSGVGVVVGFRRAAAASMRRPKRQQQRQQHVYVVRLWNRIGCDGSVRTCHRFDDMHCIDHPPPLSYHFAL